MFPQNDLQAQLQALTGQCVGGVTQGTPAAWQSAADNNSISPPLNLLQNPVLNHQNPLLSQNPLPSLQHLASKFGLTPNTLPNPSISHQRPTFQSTPPGFQGSSTGSVGREKSTSQQSNGNSFLVIHIA